MTAIKKNLQEYASVPLAECKKSGATTQDWLRMATNFFENSVPGKDFIGTLIRSDLLVDYFQDIRKSHGQPPLSERAVTHYAVCFSALASWNFTRPVVVFDPDFEEELRNSDSSLKVPASSFEKFVGNAVYFYDDYLLGTSDLFGEKCGDAYCDGALCVIGKKYFNEETKDDELVVLIVLFFRGTSLGSTPIEFALKLPVKDGAVSFADVKERFKEEFGNPEYYSFKKDNGAKELLSYVPDRLFPRLLYWLSDTPEAEKIRDGVPQPGRRRTKKFGEILTLPEKAYVRVMGTEIGNVIREYRKKVQGDDPTRTVRPHIRRAH